MGGRNDPLCRAPNRYRGAEKHGVSGQPALKYNTIWGQTRKHNMERKQKIQAEENAESISLPHHVGQPLAAPRHVVAAASGGRHHVVIHVAS